MPNEMINSDGTFNADVVTDKVEFQYEYMPPGEGHRFDIKCRQFPITSNQARSLILYNSEFEPKSLTDYSKLFECTWDFICRLTNSSRLKSWEMSFCHDRFDCADASSLGEGAAKIARGIKKKIENAQKNTAVIEQYSNWDGLRYAQAIWMKSDHGKQLCQEVADITEADKSKMYCHGIFLGPPECNPWSSQYDHKVTGFQYYDTSCWSQDGSFQTTAKIRCMKEDVCVGDWGDLLEQCDRRCFELNPMDLPLEKNKSSSKSSDGTTVPVAPQVVSVAKGKGSQNKNNTMGARVGVGLAGGYGKGSQMSQTSYVGQTQVRDPQVTAPGPTTISKGKNVPSAQSAGQKGKGVPTGGYNPLRDAYEKYLGKRTNPY